MMWKALIKKTGDIYNILHSKKNINFYINFDEEKVVTKKNNKNSSKGESIYFLSNGEKYLESEIVIGDENIRDWKIKNIIK